MLEHYGIPIAGARAVVIGRSEIVGKPMAMLLLQRDATVTICHSKTPDLPAVAREADILVAAIGRAGIRHAGVRQARRDGHRRRHQPRDRRRDRARPVRRGLDRASPISSGAESVVVGDVHPRRRRGRRGAHARSRRRRSADDRGAPQEHREGRGRPRASPCDACAARL